MNEPIVIIHGWSDEASSFKKLGRYLQRHSSGNVTEINLANWITLNDEVTFNDLRQAMDDAWNNHPVLSAATTVNIVTHSTGALVVRDWMTTKYKNAGECPIKRHIMLAPANYGSPLAHKGRSFFGRLIKGGFSNSFQTGTHLLYGLEIASDYTWNLAEKDVFSTKWYGPDKIMSTVLIGNSGYGGFKQVANEVGSDGTIRVSTANLNSAKWEIQFDEKGKIVSNTYSKIPEDRKAAFLVLEDINHSTITQPDTRFRNEVKSDSALSSIHTVGELVNHVLQLQPNQWDHWKKECSQETNRLYGIVKYHYDKVDNYYHAYQNTVIRAYDQLKNPVEEYLVEFYSGRRNRFSPRDVGFIFHNKIIYDVHNYKKNSANRSFYLDITEVEHQKLHQRALQIDINPEPRVSKHQPVGYHDVGKMNIDPEMYSKLFEGNRTLLIDVQFSRQIDLDRTFTIKNWKKH